MTTKLDELEALSKAATPAPLWKYDDGVNYLEAVQVRPSKIFIGKKSVRVNNLKWSDCELITIMRNSIDDLIAVARAAQKLKCYTDNAECYGVGFTELEKSLEKLK